MDTYTGHLAGVLRAVDRPTYNDLLDAEADTAPASRRRRALADALRSGETWQVACSRRALLRQPADGGLRQAVSRNTHEGKAV